MLCNVWPPNSISSWTLFRSSHLEVFLEKGVLKICSKCTGEHPCRSAICNFSEITLWHEYSPVILLHIFGTSFTKNTSGRLLLPLLTCTKITKRCYNKFDKEKFKSDLGKVNWQKHCNSPDPNVSMEHFSKNSSHIVRQTYTLLIL